MQIADSVQINTLRIGKTNKIKKINKQQQPTIISYTVEHHSVVYALMMIHSFQLVQSNKYLKRKCNFKVVCATIQLKEFNKGMLKIAVEEEIVII